MCNLYSHTRAVEAVRQVAESLQMPLRFPEGIPNLAPGDIAITDPGPVIRRAADDEAYELVVRRWSWPGPGGKPVYNFRSDGRAFGPRERCLVLADGFYEFTKPEDPKQRLKNRWLFADPAGGLLGIAGLVRDAGAIGEAFTMLTSEPGPDVARYHNRQVALLPPASWKAWLDGSAAASDLIGPLPAGSLTVSAAPR